MYGTSYTNKKNLSKKLYIGKSADTSRAKDNIYYGSSSNIMNHRHFLKLFS